MDIKALFAKLKPQTHSGSVVTAVIVPGWIYFSSSRTELPAAVAINDQAWLTVLVETLREFQVNDVAIELVLTSAFYQTYQIDKPNVPEEEWPAALPFLLKDLTTEKVSDIVVDAFCLPNANKLQSYLISKSLVVKLAAQLAELNIALQRILVEDEIWGSCSPDLGDFLLLERSKQSSFKVSAYVKHKCVFQRSIRGIAAPLTGGGSSALQLDSIALELQRSIDYLSSQLKGVSLHQLKLCCDEEDQRYLAQQLDDRLSVKVTTLAEPAQSVGEFLLGATSTLTSTDINLYPTHLKPKKEPVTARGLVWSWGTLAAALLVVFGYYHYQNANLNQQLMLLKRQQTELTQQYEQLNKQLSQHKPSAAKIAAVSRLKIEIDSKQAALQAVREYDQQQPMGYSGVMQSLAKLSRNDISLNSIIMQGGTLDLSGQAKDASAIPGWVSQFKNELNLVGRNFSKLKIARDDQEVITFELITRQEVQ
ncbi:PilN domain-containing protein [Vibrio sp.]|uniref:PilN domain-containing protein n=1 Tax=Vibrio sp. TaxID=678 RepID=UPI003D0A82CB